MRLRYFVVKREPTTYCGLNLVDTPDIDISAEPAPPAPPAIPGRWASLLQVVMCCGQIPTQTAIYGVLVLAGMKPPSGDALPLPFFAALSLIDTAVVAIMIFVFLRASGESIRQVFFGSRLVSKEMTLGLILIPAVLVGTGMLMGSPAMHRRRCGSSPAWSPPVLRILRS